MFILPTVMRTLYTLSLHCLHTVFESNGSESSPVEVREPIESFSA